MMSRMLQIIVVFAFAAILISADRSYADPAPQIPISEAQPQSQHIEHDIASLKFDVSLKLPRYPIHASSIVDQISLRKLPPGSLRIEYRGAYRPIIRHLNRRYRRLWSDSLEDRIAFMTDSEVGRIYQERNFAWQDHSTGGRWWERSWMDSLLPEKGGAPARPYLHIVGTDKEWELGPISISNTLKVKFDYVAVFRLNADPDPQPDPSMTPFTRTKSPVSLDIKPPSEIRTQGAHARFKVRPHLRVGLPKDGDWSSVLRQISMRAELNISIGDLRVMNMECELRLKELDELIFTFDAALVAW